MAKKSNYLESNSLSIRKVSFVRNQIDIKLSDGREVFIPVNHVPQIKQISPAARKKIFITGQGGVFNLFTFKDSTAIFKLNDNFTVSSV